VIDDGRVLGLIPARGGSKGIPRKNVRLLGGKPVLQWTVEAGGASKYIDRLILSTEDAEIAGLGRSMGVEVPFQRPDSASTDEASADDVIGHALRTLDEEFDFIVYLQPTSPFRSTADIDGSLETLVASGADSCVSVTESRSKPEWLFYLDGGNALKPVLGELTRHRRQQLQTAYELNGAVYASRVAAYQRWHTFFTERSVAWVMPPQRSVDLDEPDDFDHAEWLLRQGAGLAG
jgi:CMP-N-acetylneuraminic acid synthetase